MAGKKSRKAKKNASQKERKANCKEKAGRMDRIEAIMENDGSVEAYCKQMGDPDFRQLGDQEMMADILNWRNSILGRYRRD